MLLRRFVFPLCMALSAIASHAETLPTSFNTYVIKDFYGTQSDTEGTLVVGGSFAASSYGVNSKGSSSSLGLWVGGDASLQNGQVVGDVAVGGTWSAVNVGVTGTLTRSVNGAVVDDWQRYYEGLSRDIAKYQPTGTADRTPWGTLNFTSTATTGPHVFSIDALGLSSVNQLTFTGVQEGGKLILNIEGNLDLSNIDASVFGRFDTLLNLSNAQTLTFKNTSIWADVLAPFALLNGESGHLQGTSVLNSFKGSLEFHVGGRSWLASPTVGAVPEIPTAMMFAAGVGAGVLSRRRGSSPL